LDTPDPFGPRKRTQSGGSEPLEDAEGAEDAEDEEDVKTVKEVKVLAYTATNTPATASRKAEFMNRDNSMAL
jgi:hypothetical protein